MNLFSRTLYLTAAFFMGVVPVQAGEPVAGIPPVRITRIRFVGNHFFSEGELRKKLSYKKWKNEPLDSLSLNKDCEQLIADFSEQGFPDADITWSLSPSLSSPGTETILFQIKEGRRQFVQSLTISGNRALGSEELRGAVKLQEGQPYDPRELGQDEYLISLIYANHGYAYAKVEHQVLRDSLGQVHLTYQIEEGPQAFFGKISVTGNDHTRGEYLIAQSGMRPGQVFSLAKLGKARQSLLGTGILNQASFFPSGLTPQGKIDLTLEVKERSSHWIAAGLGYGASDQFRLSGEWGNRNLWGLGKRIIVESYGGFALVPKVRNVIAHTGITLGDPFLFSSPYRASLSGYYERETPTSGAYRAQRWGSVLGLEREWAWPGDISGEVRYERVTLSDTFALTLPDSLRYRTTHSMALRLTKDLRTPYQKTTQGILLRFSEEYAGGAFGGDNNFVRTQGGLNVYLTVSGTLTLAGRLEGGSVENLPNERAVPIYERYFLGGASSLRGYPEQGLAPEDSTRRLLGGHRYILGSFEVRIRPHKYWGGAVFSDAGNTWLAEDRLSYKALRATAGVELHYFTPVGPVRAGYAAKLRPEPGKPKGAYYAASGFAF